MYLAGWVHLLLSGRTVSGLSTVSTGAVCCTVGPTLARLAPTSLQFENLRLIGNTLWYDIHHTDLRIILEDTQLNGLIGGPLVMLRLRFGPCLVSSSLANRGSRCWGRTQVVSTAADPYAYGAASHQQAGSNHYRVRGAAAAAVFQNTRSWLPKGYRI